MKSRFRRIATRGNQYITTTADWYFAFDYIHTSGNFVVGLYDNASGTGNPIAAINPTSTQMRLQIGATTIDADDLTADTTYSIVIEGDGDYIYWRIKGGTEFPSWTELYRDGTLTIPSIIYAVFVNTDAVVSFPTWNTRNTSYNYNGSITRYATFRVSGATTFDPTITTSSGTATWYWGDGTSTTSNAPSKVYAGAGQRLARMTGVADANVLTLDSNTDGLVGDGNNVILPTFTSLVTLYLDNNSFTGDLSGWSLPATLATLYLYSNSFTGDLSGWSLPATLVNLRLYSNSFTGDLSGWSLPATLVNLYLNSNSFTGDLSGWSLPATLVTLYLYNNSFTWTAATGANAPAIEDFQIQDNAFTTASSDNLIGAIYAYRLNYTGTPVLNMAGTNAAPTGTYQIPGACPAVIPKERVYELVNDSCGDGHNLWAITIN